MRTKLLIIAAMVCCWGSFPTQASAQTRVSCASQNNQRQYCAADTRGGVALIKQVSQSACVQNKTWGYDGRGIWVDRGCRADFQIGSFNPGGGGPGGNTITCESQNNRRNYCRISDPRSNVELAQQLSQAACLRGQSWGNDGQGFWVDQGCRAQFRVTSNNDGGPGWWNSGPGHRPTDIPQNGACFFKGIDFTGDYFYMPKGTQKGTLLLFNNQISSIQVIGNALVTSYSDANFQGSHATTKTSLRNLRAFGVLGTNNQSWDNQISSLRVD